MTPEGKVKAAVSESLKDAEAYKHMPVQNGMGEPALDYHGCHRGYYLGIETKAEGGKPTVRQIRTMHKIADAGGSLFLIDSKHGTDYAQLLGWLLAPTPGFISQSARRYLNELRNDRPRNPVDPT